jgi:hypothetical protein
MAPTKKRPPYPRGCDGADKPEHNLVHHCFASERRRHWASLQALGTIRCRPPAGRAVIGFLRASAALGQCEVLASPELGRSTARRPTRKSAPTSNASRLSLAPAVKSHQSHALSHGGGFPLFRSLAGDKGGSLAGRLFPRSNRTSGPPAPGLTGPADKNSTRVHRGGFEILYRRASERQTRPACPRRALCRDQQDAHPVLAEGG